MKDNLFVDTSALIALYLENDFFHQRAVKFWQKARLQKLNFLINNFIFDELITWLCKRKGKEIAVDFGNFLLGNKEVFPIRIVLPEDEERAWQLFQKLPGRLSFTDCTCFAMMKRLGIKKVFTFDKHFSKAGLKIVP